ncbi:MAG: hypothetical protein LBO74_00285 [Candidatus Symbiothrix sp.]|jgi:hypothetical protein|nr:hypothetical protein [Candidatus Symbiothrix sp.]
MKNQYVGDVNDYKKYTLIEIISEVLNEKVLVAWMLTEDDSRNDGNKLDYLKNEKNERQFNPELFDKLKLIDKNKRGIDAVEKLLGDRYTFHSEILSDKKADREKHFESVLKKAKDAGLVFFDPDNGIEVSIRQGNKNSSKYLYWNEIQQIVESGKDVLIYQHFPRQKRETYIERLKNELHEKTKLEVLPIETANVLFLLATKQGNKLNEIKNKWEEKK